MGLFDTLKLPEQLSLPEYASETDPTEVPWQTKDLLCGQDDYRLRPIYREGDYYVERGFTGRYQLERRVPPRMKQTKEGAFRADDPEVQWWNVVRPSCDLEFYATVDQESYRYRVSLGNGITEGDIELVEKHDEFFDEDGTRRSDEYWDWFIDEEGEPTIYETEIRISEVVRALEDDDPRARFDDWNIDAGEAYKALEYYRAHESEFSVVAIDSRTVTEWIIQLADEFDAP